MQLVAAFRNLGVGTIFFFWLITQLLLLLISKTVSSPQASVNVAPQMSGLTSECPFRMFCQWFCELKMCRDIHVGAILNVQF